LSESCVIKKPLAKAKLGDILCDPRCGGYATYMVLGILSKSTRMSLRATPTLLAKGTVLLMGIDGDTNLVYQIGADSEGWHVRDA
jgi:hypothetical protein